MEIIKIVGMLLVFIIMMLGVIMIYDARKLSKKWFSFHDQNEGSKWFRIGGLLLFVLGSIVLYFI